MNKGNPFRMQNRGLTHKIIKEGTQLQTQALFFNLSPFLLLPAWNAKMMAGALAAIFDNEAIPRWKPHIKMMKQKDRFPWSLKDSMEPIH